MTQAETKREETTCSLDNTLSASAIEANINLERDDADLAKDEKNSNGFLNILFQNLDDEDRPFPETKNSNRKSTQECDYNFYETPKKLNDKFQKGP